MMGTFENSELGAVGALGDFASANRAAGCPGEDDSGASPRRYAIAGRIICIQNDCALRPDRFGQRAFFFGDRFTRSHKLDMRDADIGDNGCIRRGDLRQRRNLARMVHADFPDPNFVVRSRFQHRAGQPDVIIKVAFRFRDAEFSRQHRRDKVFGACLAVAARNRKHFERKRFSITRGEVLIGHQRVEDADQGKTVRDFAIPMKINNCANRASLGNGFDKFVAIEIFPAQRNE